MEIYYCAWHSLSLFMVSRNIEINVIVFNGFLPWTLTVGLYYMTLANSKILVAIANNNIHNN